jgi:hypothetical protein
MTIFGVPTGVSTLARDFRRYTGLRTLAIISLGVDNKGVRLVIGLAEGDLLVGGLESLLGDLVVRGGAVAGGGVGERQSGVVD